MLKALSAILLSFALAISGLAQDADNPVIAILHTGTNVATHLTEHGILDMLESYGYLNPDENYDIGDQRREIEGERVTVLWFDADWNLQNSSLHVEEALDRGADLLVVTGSRMLQVVANITAQMDQPTPILFTFATGIYSSGIAQAPCIKPAHITGNQDHVAYDRLLDILLRNDPELTSIGLVYGAGETPGEVAAEAVAALGESTGLEITLASVSGFADFGPAVEGLVSKGVETLIASPDEVVGAGLPNLATIANENELPLVMPYLGGMTMGAAVGFGGYRHYDQGVNIGRLLTAWLRDEIDLSRTAIFTNTEMQLGLNLDIAALQGLEVADETIEAAGLVWQDGGFVKANQDVAEAMLALGEAVPLEQREAGDKAFLAELQCTDEMIAEQQAELDAMDG